MTHVLEESMNTGAIFVEKLVGNQKFKEYIERFGFGEPTGVNLPAELRGNVRNLENPRATTPIFHGFFRTGTDRHATADDQCLCGSGQWRPSF
jgi:cell division protein FtsI/penicillin-binding protein 2